MKFIKSKKGLVLLATLAVAAAAAIGGYAYFSASGSGTGTATVGSAVNQIVVQGTTATALTPGNAATVSFAAWNYANQGQAMSNIHLSGLAACEAAWSTVDYTSYANATTAPTCSDTGAAATSDAACAAEGFDSSASSSTDGFSMQDVAVSPTGDGHLSANATNVGLTEHGSILMNDLNSNQDACQGKNLLLSFTTS
jgi:hypothetical protein